MAQQIRVEWLKAYAQVLRSLSAKEHIGGKVVGVDRGARYASFSVRLKDFRQMNKAIDLAGPLAGHTHTRIVMAHREFGHILYQFELPRGYWETYSRSDLKPHPGSIGVGLSDGRRQVDFTFDPPHALIAGTTGSGKSETIKSILTGFFSTYSPQELNAILIDPDGDHDMFQNVAHLNGVPIANSRKDIWHNLQYAHSVYMDRKRANNRQAAPVVVVIDEAEDALGDKDYLELVKPIARHGRKYNVNLLLATQKPTGTSLPDLLDKINNRWIGYVQNAQLSAYLTGLPGVRCHQLTGAGDIMHVAYNESERLLVAMATQSDVDRLPRSDITPPAVEETQPVDPALDEPEDRSPGRPQDPFDFELMGSLLGLYSDNSDLSVGTYGNKLGVNRSKLERYFEPVQQLLSGLSKLGFEVVTKLVENS